MSYEAPLLPAMVQVSCSAGSGSSSHRSALPLPTHLPFHHAISHVPPPLKTEHQHLQEELEEHRTETAHDMLATQMTGQGTHKIFRPLLFLT